MSRLPIWAATLEKKVTEAVPVMKRMTSPYSGCAVALPGALLADLKSLAHRGPRQAHVAGILHDPSAGCPRSPHERFSAQEREMRPALGLPGLRLGEASCDEFRDVREAPRTGQHAPELFGLTDDPLVSAHGSMLVDARAHRQSGLTVIADPRRVHWQWAVQPGKVIMLIYQQ